MPVPISKHSPFSPGLAVPVAWAWACTRVGLIYVWLCISSQPTRRNSVQEDSKSTLAHLFLADHVLSTLRNVSFTVMGCCTALMEVGACPTASLKTRSSRIISVKRGRFQKRDAHDWLCNCGKGKECCDPNNRSRYADSLAVMSYNAFV